jgi:methylphosphotriester-DNA--protein-cysteine methyltransferase
MREEGGPNGGAGVVVYYWPRGFLYLAPRFAIDRGDHRPTRRPSIRLMLARAGDIEIELVDGTCIRASAVLMGQEVKRRRIVAEGKGFVLLDLPVSTPEHAALAPLLARDPVRVVPAASFATLSPDLDRAAAGALGAQEASALRRELVQTVGGTRLEPRPHDERVQAALAFVDRHRLEDTSLERVAAAVHLSPDRLRHLFKEQLGCTISHYARTAAVWRALSQWADGEPLTAVAHEVGFHDYAHSHHAFREMFGFPPSMLKGNARGVRGGVKLIRGG